MTTVYEEHKSQVQYMQTQSAYETEVTAFSAGHGFLARNVEITPPATPLVDYDDHIGQTTKAGSVPMPKLTEWRIEGLLRPAGSTALSDDHAALTCGLFSNTNATAAALPNVSSGSTKVTAILSATAAASISAGDMIMVDTSSTVDHNFEVRAVVSVNTVNVKVSPPFTASATATKSAVVLKNYKMQTDCTETSFAVLKGTTHGAQAAKGAVPTHYGYTAGGGAPRFEYSGQAREYRQCAETTTSGVIATGTTTAYVVASKRITPGTQLAIYSGTTFREALYVTDKYSNAFTISAATKSSLTGAPIKPYLPTMTVTGNPVPPSQCYLDLELVSGTTTRLKADTFSWSSDNGISWHTRQAGDEWVNHGYSFADDQEIMFEAAVIMETSLWDLWTLGGGSADDGIDYTDSAQAIAGVLQFGTKGNGMGVRGIYMPRIQLQNIQIETEGDGWIGLTIKGKSMGDRTATHKAATIGDF